MSVVWGLLLLGGGLLVLTGLLRWLHRRRWGTTAPEPVVILTYHKVQTRLELGGTWLPPRAFRRHLEVIRRAALPVLDLVDYLDALHGESGLQSSRRGVVLTFDDGYESLYHHALPLLREFASPATVFLVTGYSGKANDWDQALARGAFRHLSWEQAREMAADGLVRFGSHGVSHRDLTALPDDELERELVESREAIARELGYLPECFCYPFGRHDARVREALRRAGYHYGIAVTNRPGVDRRDYSAVARTGMYLTDGPRALRIRLGLAHPERYWAEDLNNRIINWFTLITAAQQRRRSRRDPR
ncbi:MAG: polysaccharide deacetylase family protein [Candidatus Coatesbacteria bacterium]|nr:polysaccharide deacetylase family protein [Candidatus Coatesbacteria bacterium]